MNIRINKDKILNFFSLALLPLAIFSFLNRHFFGISRTDSFFDIIVNLRLVWVFGFLIIIIFKAIFKKFSLVSFTLALSIIIYVFFLVMYQEESLFIDKNFKLDIIIYVLAIIACKDVNYKTVIMTVLISTLLFNIYNLYSILLNDLINGVYLRKMNIRYQLGRANGGEFSVICYYILLYYCYIRNERLLRFEKILLVLLCFTVYYLTNTRLPFLLSLLALFCIFNISRISFFKTSKFFLIIALFLILVAPLIVLFLSITFDQKVDLYVMINKLLSNRLQLVNNAYYEYGIDLFSKDIIYTMQPRLYNVIDSSFMIVLIEYGVIMYIVFIAFLVYFLYMIYKNNDACLMIIFTLSVVDMLFNITLTYFQYNLLLFALSYRNTIYFKYKSIK